MFVLLFENDETVLFIRVVDILLPNYSLYSFIEEMNIAHENPDEILGTYKRYLAECQQIASKISEVCRFLPLLLFVLYIYLCRRCSCSLFSYRWNAMSTS
jgi:hypothetical protein